MRHLHCNLQWSFKLKRDEHSDFTFCFQDQEQAQRWFDALTKVGGHCHFSSLNEGYNSVVVPGTLTPCTAHDWAGGYGCGGKRGLHGRFQ